MGDKIITFLKIAGALAISYAIVFLTSDVFFVGNSPALRSRPDQYMAQKFGSGVGTFMSRLAGNVANQTKPYISVEKYREYMSSAAAKSMKQVATGTYAATVEGHDVQIIKINEIPMKEYTYTLKSGKQIKVRVPVNSTPPTQAEVDE